MNPIILETLTKNDSEKLSKLFNLEVENKSIFGDLFPKNTKIAEALIENDSINIYFINSTDEETLGACIIKKESTYAQVMIYVIPKNRKKGIGRLALNMIKHITKQEFNLPLKPGVTPENKSARAFLKSCGYVQVSEALTFSFLS